MISGVLRVHSRPPFLFSSLRSSSSLFSSPLSSRRSLCFSSYLPLSRTHNFPRRQFSHSFENTTSAAFLDTLYSEWQSNPASVDSSLQNYFSSLQEGVSGSPSTTSQTDVIDHMKVAALVRAYQVSGHRKASLDPLGLTIPQPPPELALSSYNFSEKDLGREFYLGTSTLQGFLASDRPALSLGEILKRLEEVYCGNIGFEYMHIINRQECNWIRSQIELPIQWSFTKQQKIKLLERLLESDQFEKFLATKFGAGHKRFGVEGCESLIPGMKELIDRGVAAAKLESVVIGMPHRGRLNILANVIRKPLEQIFYEFYGSSIEDEYGTGDVKYHLGMSHQRKTAAGEVHLTLLANPSHLEAVNPVVVGKVRAKQDLLTRDGETAAQQKTLGLLLHGDAAFSGQGVVYETMGFSDLKNYGTGGVIHIIVNNQIGFTTDPASSRSSPYPSDLAKAFSCPIFHVNADDPEAVAFVCRLAIDWRQTFQKDVVLDLVCYRRHGHNEGDQPMFTQPLMYKKIAQHPTTAAMYSQRLIKEGVLTQEQVDAMLSKTKEVLEKSFAASKEYKPKPADWLTSNWKEMKPPQATDHLNTGVDLKRLREIGKLLTTIPSGFQLHPVIAKVVEHRGLMYSKDGEKLDWGAAEALAYASLVDEGNIVRISGQDVERGTFSHRHAVLHEQNTNEVYIPTKNIKSDTGFFHICNSSLSEFGVLGFEVGYSLQNPYSLIVWEAQFGDFANGAQVIFDQFIASGETKWYRQSGIVVLLPHGYEGQGPEHSSARIERFLQLTNEDEEAFPQNLEMIKKKTSTINMQVVNCTTPANFFHVLRRQCHRDYRKPLIVFTPKSLLRHKLCVSTIDEMGTDKKFRRVIPDESDLVEPTKVRKILFCSGKVYYDLWLKREEINSRDVAIVRIEQLAPFPFNKVCDNIVKYPNASIVWAQEEPKNNGPWSFVQPRIATILRYLNRNDRIRYVGRETAASPATGFPAQHKAELDALLVNAFE